MDLARTIVPLFALLGGLALGALQGRASLPQPVAPPPLVCPPSPLEAELRGLELELSLMQTELEEGW